MHKPQKTAVLFQFTPLREGRRYTRATSWIQSNFNSRPSARGDSTKSRASSGSTNFNSRPSARGDFCSSGRTWVSAISIHAPPRGATRGVRNSLGDKIFQFTPLREGRRLRFLHAPHSLLFQFTPLREGRPRSCPALPRGEHFNSRPSARGDLEARPFLPQPIYFNSRPSARGDMKSCKLSDITRVFQFTPLREGRRGNGCQHGADRRISIHAPPRGATRAARTEQPHPLYFNSRPSARGDVRSRAAASVFISISIHAPPRGATMPGFASGSPCLFQFTPLREGRRRFNGGHLHLQHFNSRPSARGDSRSASTGLTCSKFQFTPLREGRRRCGANKGGEPHISIHAPPRGATTAATQAVSPVT